MKPQYIVVAGTPKVVLLDTNRHVFNTTIRLAAGQTIEGALEDVADPVTAPNSPGPVWGALTPSTLGANLYVLVNPIRLLRITGPGTATVLQQGI
jgi:hypothetical protein